MDIKWEKVCNQWVLFALSVSFLRHCMEGGTGFLAGSLLPLCIFFPLFYWKMLGTGDIKVFSVLGSFLGGRDILWCIALSFVAGAVISLPILLFRCDYRQRFSYFFTYAANILQKKEVSPYLMTGRRPENIHFTVPIVISVLLLAAGRVCL